jgi:hypothetical protein
MAAAIITLWKSIKITLINQVGMSVKATMGAEECNYDSLQCKFFMSDQIGTEKLMTSVATGLLAETGAFLFSNSKETLSNYAYAILAKPIESVLNSCLMNSASKAILGMMCSPGIPSSETLSEGNMRVTVPANECPYEPSSKSIDSKPTSKMTSSKKDGHSVYRRRNE